MLWIARLAKRRPRKICNVFRVIYRAGNPVRSGLWLLAEVSIYARQPMLHAVHAATFHSPGMSLNVPMLLL